MPAITHQITTWGQKDAERLLESSLALRFMKGLIVTSDEHRYIPVSSRVVPNIHGLWSIFQSLEGNIAALYLKVSTKTAGWEQSSENHQTFHKFVASSASSVEATNIFDQAAYAGLHNHIVATSHHAGMWYVPILLACILLSWENTTATQRQQMCFEAVRLTSGSWNHLDTTKLLFSPFLQYMTVDDG